jgi:hypothetical protein
MFKNLERDDKILGQPNNQGSNLSGDKIGVDKLSEEWRLVEYHLKSSLTNELEIKNVIPISNQHMIINFDKRSKNKLYTYAWYNHKVSGEDNNSLKQLKSRGFEILPDQGMDFIVGSLLDETNEEGNVSEDSSYVLCKIIIGRSYCKIIRDKGGFGPYSMEKSIKKPPGYDSIMFCPADSNTTKSAKTGWGSSKLFVYRIFDSTNVLPMYWVTFSPMDTTSYNMTSKHICAECETKEADWYCHNCEEFICGSCYDQIHGDSTNDKNAKEIFSHKKEAVKSKIKPGKCVFDPDKDVEFYCNSCKLTICSYCKVIGSHSKGEAATHVLDNIVVAYNNLAPDKIEVIKIAEEKKKKALDYLKSLKDQISNLKTTNMEKALTEINTAFEEENRNLQAKSLESMLNHLSIMNELLVIKDSINWYDKYFTDREAYLKENNNKAEFIWVWNHHNRMVQEVMHNKSLTSNDNNKDYKNLFDLIKMNELKIFHYRFEESINFKEQNKEDNIKKYREGKKGYKYFSFLVYLINLKK